MIIGTNCFKAMAYAVKYYRQYGYENAGESVRRKIADGEIRIGEPEYNPLESRIFLDADYRYHVYEFSQYEKTVIACLLQEAKTAIARNDAGGREYLIKRLGEFHDSQIVEKLLLT